MFHTRDRYICGAAIECIGSVSYYAYIVASAAMTRVGCSSIRYNIFVYFVQDPQRTPFPCDYLSRLLLCI